MRGSDRVSRPRRPASVHAARSARSAPSARPASPPARWFPRRPGAGAGAARTGRGRSDRSAASAPPGRCRRRCRSGGPRSRHRSPGADPGSVAPGAPVSQRMPHQPSPDRSTGPCARSFSVAWPKFLPRARSRLPPGHGAHDRGNRGLVPGRPSPDRFTGRCARSMSLARPKSLPRGGVRASARSWPARPRQPRPCSGPAVPGLVRGTSREVDGPGLSEVSTPGAARATARSLPARPRQPRPCSGPALPGPVHGTMCEVDVPGPAEVSPPGAGSAPPPGHDPRTRDNRGLGPSHPSPARASRASGGHGRRSGKGGPRRASARRWRARVLWPSGPSPDQTACAGASAAGRRRSAWPVVAGSCPRRTLSVAGRRAAVAGLCRKTPRPAVPDPPRPVPEDAGPDA